MRRTQEIMKHPVFVVIVVTALLQSSSAQQFNNNFQAQQSQNPNYRFTGQEFPTFSQQGSQQVSNFFRPSQQQLQQFQSQPNPTPAQAIQPPLPTFQQPPPPSFQPQQNFQQPQQQNFQQPQQQNFQQPQNNFQPSPQVNFQQPQTSFQQPQNFQQTPFPQQQNFQQFNQPQQNTFQQPQVRPQPQQQQNFQQQANFKPQQTFDKAALQSFGAPQAPSVSNNFAQQQPQQPIRNTQAPVAQPTTTSTVATPTTPSQEQLQRQYTQQLRQRAELLQQLSLATTPAPEPQQPGINSVFLANGQKLQVLTVNPKSAAPSTTTPKPKPPVQAIKAAGGLLDAVTQGVVPTGVNYEVIRQKQDGDLENIQGLPSDLPRKVTFVILEEQDDGSYKVQGVRKGAGVPEGSDIAAEAAKAAATGEEESKEVQSLIQKLQDGRLKLPSQDSVPAGSRTTPRTIIPTTATTTTTTYRPRPTTQHTTRAFISTTPTPAFIPTLPPATFAPVLPSRGSEASQSNQVNLQVPSPTRAQPKKSASSSSLGDALRAQGLRSMAQFLEQVGLDRALNDSAPYTMFAPTDLAFRALLLELGGADRAQAKFRASPRLLSGLLLHHVIPGGFNVEDLQDEMTGVSLAGTQLRVNVYANTDPNFNSRKVVTINGGSIVERSKDIILPGGSVAHAVSRVLFPLPVGDLLTSLEADPARRFGRFVRAAKETGLDEILKAPLPDSSDDGRTYTVFAPTDDALTAASPEIQALLDGAESPERKAALRILLEKHISPGTLFSEGVTYYQAASSLAPDQPLRLFNDNGVFKVNSARVITPDIPATNGVIHAVDNLL